MERPRRPPIDVQPHARSAVAYFGMGLFWGSDSQFGSMPGVIRTVVGDCGGEKPHATYHDIGDHTETVEVV